MKVELLWPAVAGARPGAASLVQQGALPLVRGGRIRPRTRVRPGDVFQYPSHGDVAVIESGCLIVELMMSCGSILPLTRFSDGAVVPTLDSLSTPAFSLSYRAAHLTQIAWLRGDVVGTDLQDRGARTYETLLFASMRQITSLACLPAAYRLYVEILRAAPRTNNAEFELPSHTELASRICSTRETVSREISILRREGVLSQGKRVILLAPGDLTKRIARALNLESDTDVLESIGAVSPTEHSA